MAINPKGISIIELLVVVAIISIALVGLLNTTSVSLKFSSLMKENDQAKALAEEALEVVRNFRDGTTWNINGLGILALDTAYHPEKVAGVPQKWNLVLGEETINIFARKIVIKKVFRDSNSNIASTGTEDVNTKQIVATVSWEMGTRKVEISTYLTNWR
jgi:prepilin-type N-terminal cleavage/methylation domain-containing protein